MTVEALDQMMTYIIETWMIVSAAYLGFGYVVSLRKRIKDEVALEQDLQNQVEDLETVAAATIDEVSEAARLTEVTAVSQKYGKTATPESVTASISVSE